MKLKNLATVIIFIVLLLCVGCSNNTAISNDDVKPGEDSVLDVGKNEDKVEEFYFDEEKLIEDINAYYKAFKDEDTSGIVSKMYFSENVEDNVKYYTEDYDSWWETVDKVRKDVSGINVYSIKSNGNKVDRVYLLYALGESNIKYKNDGTSINSDYITSLYGTEMILDDGLWKIESRTNLEGIMYNEDIYGEYKHNPYKYITDYIGWYLENEEVRVNDKLFYEIKVENY